MKIRIYDPFFYGEADFELNIQLHYNNWICTDYCEIEQ